MKTALLALKMGAFDFMEKPVDIKRLLEKVNEAKTKRDLLAEKKSENDIKDILKKKGW